MQKSILIGFIFTVMMSVSCSDNKISEDKVPSAVVSIFKGKYPAASDTKWITEKKTEKLFMKHSLNPEEKKLRQSLMKTEAL